MFYTFSITKEVLKTELIQERYKEKIQGTLSCYDRVMITGTLPGFCYARGMTHILYERGIRIFDYPRFAEPLRNAIRNNAEQIAKENGLEIEFIQKKNFRKEERIKEILKKRGCRPGIVHIFSAMEPCQTYKPWHNKQTQMTYLKPSTGKCLHYYFYFIDEEMGLCHVHVPTWSPFRLQIYFNGHNMLANQLKENGIGCKMLDNAFLEIDDFGKAQELADSFSVGVLHRKLDSFAKRFCPVIKRFHLTCHWSIMQAEYATDIVFKRQKDLKPIYEGLSITAIHTVKPDNVAMFLGRKLNGNYQDEIGSNFSTRIEGTRIKHSMGKVSIKMYDKFSQVLRIETTVNDVSFFKHYRRVEHRDGTTSMKLAGMKKGIYSLHPLKDAAKRANMRYIEFISSIDDRSAGVNNLNRISKRVVKNKRSYKGFNPVLEDEQRLFETLSRGEYNITGFQNKNLREKMKDKTSAQISRMIKRLRVHGLARKIPHSYRYHLTKLGRAVIVLGLKLKEMVVIPELNIQRLAV